MVSSILPPDDTSSPGGDAPGSRGSHEFWSARLERDPHLPVRDHETRTRMAALLALLSSRGGFLVLDAAGWRDLAKRGWRRAETREALVGLDVRALIETFGLDDGRIGVRLRHRAGTRGTVR